LVWSAWQWRGGSADKKMPDSIARAGQSTEVVYKSRYASVDADAAAVSPDCLTRATTKEARPDCFRRASQGNETHKLGESVMPFRQRQPGREFAPARLQPYPVAREELRSACPSMLFAVLKVLNIASFRGVGSVSLQFDLIESL
jgi:hypothetical protein